MRGKVTLVGAGPGDPGLLTVKGKQALEQAEAVVYDRLVCPEILQWIPAEADRIDVGKNAGHHPIPQSQINRILVNLAQEGKRVVRLKGGDPFLFGRGGEELEQLSAHQIPFEVVPGVTSAIAVPAYGGIPVTHRDCSSSLHIITGHLRDNMAGNLAYDRLVQLGGTLVFLMGVTALRQICDGLLQGGMDPDMPAAIIENGTLPRQRKVLATVSTLACAAETADIKSPAISVFGKVCAYSDSFDFFTGIQSLQPTVIVTRPEGRSAQFAGALRRAGIRVVEYPCIQTLPRWDAPEVLQAAENLSAFRWVVFTSPKGPELFRDALFRQGKDLRDTAHLKFAVIGPGTARVLENIGIRYDLMPEVYDTLHLAQALVEEGADDILIFRSAQGSPVLPEVLSRHQIAFRDVACYDTVPLTPDNAEVLQAMRQERVCVTFTSASTVHGFVQSLPKGTDLANVTAFCIGEVTAKRAREYGFPVLVAEEATMDSLYSLIESQLFGRE